MLFIDPIFLLCNVYLRIHYSYSVLSTPLILFTCNLQKGGLALIFLYTTKLITTLRLDTIYLPKLLYSIIDCIPYTLSHISVITLYL